MISIKKSLFLKIKNVLDKGYILFQMIKRMKKLGFDLKQISQITGIREEEIEKILCKNIADEK